MLAGDHCKSASDLGIPLVGVGLLYKKGYFTQKIDASGGQHAETVAYDFAKLPIYPAYITAASSAEGDTAEPQELAHRGSGCGPDRPSEGMAGAGRPGPGVPARRRH
ncbi:hypothetical protein LJK87_30340 [Paenibacillus sp. P25]|nr:hypothetical protein LJK87_30340 [Paenibacillus sp. P25]